MEIPHKIYYTMNWIKQLKTMSAWVPQETELDL